jgi:ribosomal protein S17E
MTTPPTQQHFRPKVNKPVDENYPSILTTDYDERKKTYKACTSRSSNRQSVVVSGGEARPMSNYAKFYKYINQRYLG